MWIFVGVLSAVICLIMVWAVALKGYRYFTLPSSQSWLSGIMAKKDNIEMIETYRLFKHLVLAISSRVFTMKKLLSVLAKVQ